jgi:pimeloyl-ACP methyl ester carboxylesterase
MRFLSLAILGAVAGVTETATLDCTGINAINPNCNSTESSYKRDVFFVGGDYVPYSTTYIRTGQLYVEKLTPVSCDAKKFYPLVFISAGVPSGSVWLNTPDNRKGWASQFLDECYMVYIVDITANGRSGQNDLTTYPPKLSSDVKIHENDYTAPELIDPYPQSLGHDKWVGNGTQGDAIFDAFFAAAGPMTSNTTALEMSMRQSGCKLLELLGTQAYIISHSAGATYGSLMSDECPDRVRATINLEPGNTPL